MKVPTPPGFVANFDSATAMSLALARFLRGQNFPALGQPPAMKPLAKRVNRLPRRLREKVFVFGGATETVSPRRVHRLDMSEWGAWLSQAYPKGRYPVVAVGSSNGALNHLYAALGVPWLPQTYLIPVRQRVHPDDPVTAMERGVEPGRALLEANPDLQLHHMHDANQDRLMVRALTYFRLKRRRLGPDFEAFLDDRLEPGGTIMLVDCRARWRTTASATATSSSTARSAAPRRRSSTRAVNGWPTTSSATTRRCDAGRAPRPTPRAPGPSGASRRRSPRTCSASRASAGTASSGSRSTSLRTRAPSSPTSTAAGTGHGVCPPTACSCRASSSTTRTGRCGAVPCPSGWCSTCGPRSRPSMPTSPTPSATTTSTSCCSSTAWRRSGCRRSRSGGRCCCSTPRSRAASSGSNRTSSLWTSPPTPATTKALKEIPARHPLPPPLPLAEVERFVDEHAGRYAVEWREELPRL